jgi:hypothetical protein
MRNTDTSQESRETKSHTTQLTQMYHQLDSYHLGTNRAVFFIHPRPHTLENEHTFVNGPRNIEGIQEFVFVVVRPTSVAGLCVEAYLETGHIGKVPHAELQEIPGSELRVVWSDKFHAQPKGDDDPTTVFDAADRVWDVASHNPGYKIKSVAFTAGPYVLYYNYSKPNLVDVAPHISSQNDDFIVVSGKVHSGFANYAVDRDRWEAIDYPFTAEILLVKKEVVQRSDDTLFLTARRLCCCKRSLLERTPEVGIVYERGLAQSVAVQQRQPEDRLPISVANLQARQIREAVIRSRDDVEHRHDKPLNLPLTDFAARTAANGLRSVPKTTIKQVDNLPARLQKQVNALNEDLTTRELLSMPASMLQDVLNISAADAVELRSTLLGISNVKYDYRKAWLSDEQIDRLYSRSQKPKPPSRS